ncbi:hypothetical protein ABKN59_002446 [Abortiporus biennis]
MIRLEPTTDEFKNDGVNIEDGKILAQLIELYSGVFAMVLVNFSSITIVIYDYFLTIGDEIAYIWSQKITGASIIFLLNRYLTLLYVLLLCLSLSGIHTVVETDIVCDVLQYGSNIIGTCIIIVHAAFASLRIFAIWGQNLYLAIFVGSLFVVYVVISVAKDSKGYEPVQVGIRYMKILLISNGFYMLGLIMVMFLTFLKTYSIKRDASWLNVKVPYSTLLLRDGSIQFFVIFGIAVIQDIAQFTLSLGAFDVINLTLSSILITHFMLHLRDVHLGSRSGGGGGGRTYSSPDDMSTLQFASESVLNRDDGGGWRRNGENAYGKKKNNDGNGTRARTSNRSNSSSSQQSGSGQSEQSQRSILIIGNLGAPLRNMFLDGLGDDFSDDDDEGGGGGGSNGQLDLESVGSRSRGGEEEEANITERERGKRFDVTPTPTPHSSRFISKPNRNGSNDSKQSYSSTRTSSLHHHSNRRKITVSDNPLAVGIMDDLVRSQSQSQEFKGVNVDEDEDGHFLLDHVSYGHHNHEAIASNSYKSNLDFLDMQDAYDDDNLISIHQQKLVNEKIPVDLASLSEDHIDDDDDECLRAEKVGLLGSVDGRY